MRVLLVSDVTAPGGVDTHMAALAKWAQPLGARVELLVDRGALTPAREARLRSAGVPLHHADIYHRRIRAPEQRANIAEVLGKCRPDVVHVMCGIPWSCLEVREAVLDLGVPLVFTEAYVPRGLRLDPAVTKRICSLYREVPAVIFLCRENQAALQEEHGISSNGAMIIPSAVEVGAWARGRALPEQDAQGRPFRLVTIARLAYQKGIDTLLEAARILRGTAAWQFTVDIFGDGPLRGELESQSRRAQLTEQVRFRGWTLHPVSELSQFDCYVQPSRSEGQPFAMLEAMASGLPVVASAVSGIPEALEGGRGGTLVPADDPQALAEAIAAIRSDPAGAQAMARRAGARVAKHHNIERAVVEHLEVWRRAAHQM